MKIMILRACFMSGKPRKIGEVVDAPDRDANEAIGLKKAVAFVEPKKESAPDAKEKPKGGKE